MTARSPGPGSDERVEIVRDLERRRVQSELRSRLFGAPPAVVQVDRFELRRKLGEGAMGVVYAAFDPRLQREVALKLLTAIPRGGEDGVLGEARALARLAHPNVLAVHEAGVHEGVAFLVSELVVGGTLRSWLASSPPRGTAAILGLLRDVGRGVGAAHQRGLVHRDLKPENILVGGDGRPRVADFGLAQPADRSLVGGSPQGRSSSPLPGTLAYMAPEQLRGERADPRSDQYSFCVLAFEALFGRHPFEASTPAELLAAMERAAIVTVPPSHPAMRAMPALRRGLRPEAEARWPSFVELLAALEPSRRRVPLPAIVLGSLAALGAIGAGAGAWIQITERNLAHEVVGLTEQQRYRECADLLDEGAIEDGLLYAWIGCIQASSDEARLGRACDAWPSRTRAPPPDVCAPVPRAARKLFVAGRYRECAETVLAAAPSPAGGVVLADCLAQLRDVALYRRQCRYQLTLHAPTKSTVDCDAGTHHLPPR